MLISISECFYILLLFPGELVLETELDLFTLLTVFSVSVIWVDINLTNDLPLSYLLLLDVYTFLLDACDFSALLTVSIFFFVMGGVIAYFTTLGFVPMSVFPYLTTVLVVVTNEFSVSYKSPLVFLNIIPGFSYLFCNWSLIFEDMISVLGLLYQLNYKIRVRFNSDIT